ncbi:MAG: YbhB/YbcL family Raf kinase inhibitor-like protein [Candidatus Hydrogenedentota bacterium]
MELISPAFEPGTRIPAKYTKEGNDVSPPLSWNDVPAAARSFALVCDDPDAPTAEPWVHWLLWNIPANATEIPEGGSGFGIEGTNSFGEPGYGGPMPPPGHGTHHYHFTLYALDGDVAIEPGASKESLLRAMDGHVLAEAEYVGTYER